VLPERTEPREGVLAKGARGAARVLVHVVPAGALLPKSLIALAAVEHSVPGNHPATRVHVQIQEGSRRRASRHWHLGARLQERPHYP
jgi:hypothetical protein